MTGCGADQTYLTQKAESEKEVYSGGRPDPYHTREGREREGEV
jgi:hypothetical protein